jgi:hypothetical protein
MVSVSTLATVTNATDNDPWLYVMPDGEYLAIMWYRDVTYGGDDYGCTTPPNIFHLWLVRIADLAGQTPPNVPHVNLLGVECVSHWTWSEVPFIYARRSGRDLLLITGGRYVGGSNIVKRLAVVDITNRSSPQVLKILEDTASIGFRGDMVYDMNTDRLCVQTSDNVLRCDTLANILGYPAGATLRSIPSVATLSQQVALMPAGSRYAQLHETRQLLDMDTLTLSSYPADMTQPCDSGVKYCVELIKDASNNITGVKVRDNDTLTLIRTISLPSTIPAPSPLWNIGRISMGSLYYIGAAGNFALIDLDTGSVTQGTLPITLWYAHSKNRVLPGGKIIAFRGGGSPATGDIVAITPDSAINIVYDRVARKIYLRDLAGNPVANRTALLRKLRVASDGRMVTGSMISRISGADGSIDISDLAGVIRIET